MTESEFNIDDVLPGGTESSIDEDALPEVTGELNNINRYIVYMAAAGHKPEQIAKMLNMHVQSIRRILNSPLVAAEVKKIVDRVGKGMILDRIKFLTVKAIDVVDRAMDNKKPEVQLRAAEDIFKLTGMMNGDKAREDTASYRDILDRLDAVEAENKERALKSVRTLEGEAVGADNSG